MARGIVFLRLPTDLPGADLMLARTNLTGHGSVREGEQFTAREMWPQGDRLLPGGRKLRVKVIQIERIHRSHQAVHVEILEDLTPVRGETEELF